VFGKEESEWKNVLLGEDHVWLVFEAKSVEPEDMVVAVVMAKKMKKKTREPNRNCIRNDIVWLEKKMKFWWYFNLNPHSFFSLRFNHIIKEKRRTLMQSN